MFPKKPVVITTRVFLAGQLSFLLHNQQCQNAEGNVFLGNVVALHMIFKAHPMYDESVNSAVIHHKVSTVLVIFAHIRDVHLAKLLSSQCWALLCCKHEVSHTELMCQDNDRCNNNVM